MMTDEQWDGYKADISVEDLHKHLITKYYDHRALYDQLVSSKVKIDRVDLLYWVSYYLERVSMYSYLPDPKRALARVYSHNGARLRGHIAFGDYDRLGGNMLLRIEMKELVNMIADDWKERKKSGVENREEGYIAIRETMNYYYLVWYFLREIEPFKKFYVVEFPKTLFNVKWVKDEIDFILERLI